VPSGRWQPTQFVRFEKAFDTSVGTSTVVTDAGKAYLKALGNRQGPHALVCEWVGTRLADWFGLATFDYALLMLDENDEIPLPRGLRALPGSAFVTREEPGFSWGGDPKELETLANPADVSRLVVFDTWTRNCDRHSPAGSRVHYDNVFFSREGVSADVSRLIAMDHTHCFTCGKDLDASMANIETVKDPRSLDSSLHSCRSPTKQLCGLRAIG
jgi:HipA-like protein